MTDLFIRLLHVSFTASWILLAVLVLRLLLKKAPKWITCLLWVILALRLILPVFPESRVSLVPDTEPQPAITVQTPEVPQSTVPAAPQPTWERYLPIASVVWAAGVAAMVGYSLIAWLRLRHKVQASVLLQAHVYACDQVDSPFILGFFRPRIYVPSGMEDSVLQSVLAHENAHIKRKDHWWKPLGFLLLSVYWFHPGLWLAYWLLCRDIERACDEKAIAKMDNAGKKAYSQALILCSIPRRMIMACPVAFGEVAIKDRIKGIVRYKKPAFWIVAVSVVVCIVTAVCFLTDPKTCDHEYGSQLLTAPTCTHQGTKQFTCTKCDHSYTAPVPLVAHSYDEGTVTQAPDCTHTGTLEQACTGCGAKTTKTLPVTEHTAGQTVTIKEATCTEAGQMSVTCAVCNVEYEMQIPVDANAHALQEKVTRKATCAVAGEGVRSCTRCDYSETCTYPTLAHNYIDIGFIHYCYWAEKPQCCTGCGTERVVANTPTGHQYGYNNTCIYCGSFGPRTKSSTSSTTTYTPPGQKDEWITISP